MSEDNDSNIINNLSCEHYKRGCKLLYPCCDKYFSCRFCHDNNMTFETDIEKIHDAIRTNVEKVKCLKCNEEQNISDSCIKCHFKFGSYYCNICKLLDLEDKGQFHCNKCGLCRQGGKDNFIHCDDCDLCVPNENHECMKKKPDGTCVICSENLFDYTLTITTMICGHWIHSKCLNEMLKNNNYTCPLCSKYIVNKELIDNYIDNAVKNTVMPEEYNKDVNILCNQCNEKTTVKFHFYGHKCEKCNSYNTRII